MDRVAHIFWALALATLAVSACGDDGGAVDGATDATADAGADTGADTGPADWSACTATSQCTLAVTGCCGGCPWTVLERLDAINEAYAEDHRMSVCPEPGGCEPCNVRVDPISRPAHFATCSEARCEKVDVAASPMAACSDDDECRVRVRDCCECGADTGSGNLVAIRSDADAAFMDVVCDEPTCDLCAPVYPDDVQAFCDAGVCGLRRPAP